MPSFFPTKKKGEAMGDFEGRMYPFSSCSSIHLLSSSSSAGDSGYVLQPFGVKSGLRSMAWSHFFLVGIRREAFSSNNLRYLWYRTGTIFSKDFGGCFVACSCASLCAWFECFLSGFSSTVRRFIDGSVSTSRGRIVWKMWFCNISLMSSSSGVHRFSERGLCAPCLQVFLSFLLG